jgi:single-stranded-DNA-specific exonuclease
MKHQWSIKNSEFKKIKNLQVEPIVALLLFQRGIKTKELAEQFLNPNYERDLHNPFLFKDMKKMIVRLKKAIKNNERVGVFGDHDVDGVSSSVLMVEVLEKLNLKVSVYIPDKLTEGHGINHQAINDFSQMNISLMITVDCGVSDIKMVDIAKKNNIETIITDHHQPADQLPRAVAIINPHLQNCKYPFKNLCGVGVVFKIIQAIYQEFFPKEIEQLKWLLDIVGVGTVADCMPLLGENRTLVKYGLVVLAKTQRIGYQQMITVGKMPIGNGKIPTAETVAFQIAPRINAAGRMSHAKEAYDLLRENDSNRALIQAQRIEKQNVERRKITEKIFKEVDEIVEAKFKNKKFILVAKAQYPVGIVGIVAGRIADKYGKPAGIFTREKKQSKGSFRSAQGVHILKALKESKHLLQKFGGHKQAAGAIIDNGNLKKFQTMMEKSIENQLKNLKVISNKEVDLEISHQEINFELINELKKFEPFGHDNPEPKFLIKNLKLAEVRGVGNKEQHLKLKLLGENEELFEAIGFNLGNLKQNLKIGDKVETVCNLGENEWMGNTSIQFKLIDIGKMK